MLPGAVSSDTFETGTAAAAWGGTTTVIDFAGQPTQEIEVDDAVFGIEPNEGVVHQTPVLTSSYYDDRLGMRCFFKCENLQKVGAFKARGAMNAVLALSDDAAARGVMTHSSGNHAAALAYAASARDVPCVVVMPRSACKNAARSALSRSSVSIAGPVGSLPPAPGDPW